MYGKYSDKRIQKELAIFKALRMVDKNGNIDENLLSSAYGAFRNNIEEMKQVFPYESISIYDIATAPEGDVWTWDSQEELDRTKEEIINNGFYLPLIVLEKGIIHRDKNAGIEKYHVLDGNHRVSAYLELVSDGLMDEMVKAFIFPEYCIEVRKKMTPKYRGEKYNHHQPIKLQMMPHSTRKLNINRLKFIPMKNIFVSIKTQNKLEIYNIAMSIGHEITPLMYIFYQQNGYIPDKIKEKTFKVKHKSNKV